MRWGIKCVGARTSHLTYGGWNTVSSVFCVITGWRVQQLSCSPRTWQGKVKYCSSSAADTMVQNMKGKENFCKYFGNSGYSVNKYPCNGQVCEKERKTVAHISLITPAVAQLPAWWRGKGNYLRDSILTPTADHLTAWTWTFKVNIHIICSAASSDCPSLFQGHAYSSLKRHEEICQPGDENACHGQEHEL